MGSLAEPGALPGITQLYCIHHRTGALACVHNYMLDSYVKDRRAHTLPCAHAEQLCTSQFEGNESARNSDLVVISQCLAYSLFNFWVPLENDFISREKLSFEREILAMPPKLPLQPISDIHRTA